MTDLINSLFEAFAALAILNHARIGIKNKNVGGVSISSTAFFTAWGIWNVWYYPSIEQYYSFCAGMAVLLANFVWLTVLYRFTPKDHTND
jgi:hypothetical protein